MLTYSCNYTTNLVLRLTKPLPLQAFLGAADDPLTWGFYTVHHTAKSQKHKRERKRNPCLRELSTGRTAVKSHGAAKRLRFPLQFELWKLKKQRASATEATCPPLSTPCSQPRKGSPPQLPKPYALKQKSAEMIATPKEMIAKSFGCNFSFVSKGVTGAAGCKCLWAVPSGPHTVPFRSLRLWVERDDLTECARHTTFSTSFHVT